MSNSGSCFFAFFVGLLASSQRLAQTCSDLLLMRKSSNDIQQLLQIQNIKCLWLMVTKLLDFVEIHKDKGMATFLLNFLIWSKVLPYWCPFHQNFKYVWVLIPDILFYNHYFVGPWMLPLQRYLYIVFSFLWFIAK